MISEKREAVVDVEVPVKEYMPKGNVQKENHRMEWPAVPSLSMIHFQILNPRIYCGENLDFTFTIENSSSHSVIVSLDYELSYSESDGSMICQRFPISSGKCPVGYMLYNYSHVPGSSRFAGYSTPAEVPVSGELSILINGKKQQPLPFEVLLPSSC